MFYANRNAPLNSPDAKYRVTAIGSCRVVGPLRIGREKDAYELNQAGVYGYCHAAKEAVQQARALMEERAIPDYLQRFIAPGVSGAKLLPHKPSHLYVVEICSAKELMVDGFYLQLNYLTKHFSDFFSDRNRARLYWRLARDGNDADRAHLLKSYAGFAAMGPEDQHVLRNLQMSESTEHSLTADLEHLGRLLPDMLVVTHFNARKHCGQFVRSRANFVAMLSATLRSRRVQYFDPSDYVEATGQRSALENEGESLSHYAPRFEQFLADLWTNRYILPRAAELTKTPPPRAMAEYR